MENNSPHLRHLTFNETFESSLVERNQQKFMVDKSLINGIKQNDVNKIIDRGEEGGNQDVQELYNELGELEQILVSTRKKYDEVKTMSLKSQKDIENLKHKKEILAQEQSNYNELINKQRKDLEEVTQKLDNVSQIMQTAVYRKDIYRHLKDTLKKDMLVLKKRYFDKDVILMRDKTKLTSVRNQHENKIKLSKKCRIMLESVEKSVNQKYQERNNKINSFCDVLARKQINQRNKQMRDRQIQGAMISAMTDKLQQEKQWMKILQVNIFLKNMLRIKMQRIMSNYNLVEISFHKMKQSTSIKTAQEFIEKYLNREQTYGLLLQSISDKQLKLEEVKEQRDHLEKNYSETVSKSDQINEEMKKFQIFEENSFQKSLEQVNQKLLSIQRQKQLIHQWGTRFLASYHGHKTREQYSKKFPKGKENELFQEILKTINTFVSQLNSEENADKKVEEVYLKTGLKEKTLTTQMSERNTRIKTQSAYEHGSNFEIEDKDVAYDDLSEMDYLQHNRRAIKKNQIQNRRFRIKTKPY